MTGRQPARTAPDARMGGMNRIAAAVPALLVFLVTLAFQLPFFDRWVNFMDEGHLLQFADMIASGGDLYRDATVYPLPGSFYFLAGLFRIFEPSVILTRWVVTLQFSAFVALCYVLVRKLVPLSYAVSLVALLLCYRIWAFPHWHMYSYSTSALLIFLCCAMTLLRFFETGRTPLLILAGVIYGVGVAFKQDYGAATLLALSIPMVVFARSRSSEPGVVAVFTGFLGPAAGVGLAVGAYFAWRGLLGDLLRFTVFNHFVGMASYEYMSFPNLWPLFEQDPFLRTTIGIASHFPAILVTVDWQTINESWAFNESFLLDLAIKAFYRLPYLILAFGALRLVSRRRELGSDATRDGYLRELTLWSIGLGLIMLITLNRPQDYVHMAVLYWPILCLVVVYARALRLRSPRIAVIALLALALPAASAANYTYQLARKLHDVHDTYLDNPRAGVYLTAAQAETIGGLVNRMAERTDPDDRILVIPYSPLLNFLADRDGPHRTSYILWPFPEIEDRDLAVIESMERHDTDMVVYDFVYFHDFPRIRDYAPELFSYLVENFEMTEVYSSDEPWPKKYAIAERRPESADGDAINLQVEGVDVFIGSQEHAPYPIEPDRWSEYVTFDLWPLRPVLTLRPSLGDRETVLSVPLDVPPGARLVTSIGVKPVLWDKLPPSWVRFAIAIRSGAEREILFERTIDPSNVVADRRWFPVDVDLGDFAGRTVHVEFSTSTQRERAETVFMGGWGMPRILSTGDPGRNTDPPPA